MTRTNRSNHGPYPFAFPGGPSVEPLFPFEPRLNSSNSNVSVAATASTRRRKTRRNHKNRRSRKN